MNWGEQGHEGNLGIPFQLFLRKWGRAGFSGKASLPEKPLETLHPIRINLLVCVFGWEGRRKWEGGK